ncbi:hypothetical protein BGX21_004383 [Mortierella sp. AD011]|nr:hypothetical protein BGX20_000826 [Mortierella sp. AD010]KAF9400403.1 hypothetical protein BGX21_004383 [Mortierella sp. AD011]
MSSPRPSSNQRTLSNGSSTAVSPRRAKVSSLAQMDISSVPYSPKSNPGSAPVASANSSRGPSATYNSTNAPVRAPSVKVRTSNSVTATSLSRNPSGGGSTISSSRKDSGSVTSDDGTISEDSDLTRDEMLFTGGQANVGGGITLPFGASKRPASIGGPVYGVGIKLGATTVSGGNGLSRHRSSSSIVGLSSGSIVSGITPKPMRMAAGATIKIDSLNNNPGNYISSSHSSLGLSSAPGSTVGSQMSPNTTGLTSSATMPIWSTPSSPSLSRNGSFRRSGGGGDDGSSTISVSSTNPHYPTVRSNKNIGSANIKQTEESRRNEEAARTRRKIQDLEISNSSLLNLNQSLETTNRKLVAEIQELKTRIQSAHSGELGYTAADLALARNVEAIELTEEEKNDDLTFKRLCLSIEHLVHEAKQALDQASKPAGVRVLSLYDMYEKEVAEEAEAEEAEEDNIEDDDIHSVNQDHPEDMYAIEVIDHDDDGDTSSKDGIDGDSNDNHPIPYMISSTIMEAPLTMVV